MFTCNFLNIQITRRFAYLTATSLFMVLIITGVSVATPIVDGPIAREKLERDAKDLLYQQKFDELEKTAQHLRKTKARFPDGHWKLSYFYNGLTEPPQGTFKKSKFKWDRHFALLEKWRTVYPRSITAQTAAAKAWIAYGEEARGGGYASTVSEEGWKLLRERINIAVVKLEEMAPTPEEDCPERYSTLMSVGVAQGWQPEKFMALSKKAIAFEPHYHQFYAATAGYLTPRWYGTENEWIEFAEKADAFYGDPESREIYTRIVIGWWDMEWKDFKDLRISWSKMNKGFRDMMQKFPDSQYNLNNYAKFACMAGDMEVARDLLLKIGNTPYLKVWKSPSKLYDDCRKAAGSRLALRSELKDSQENIQTRILADQGDKLSQYLVAIQYLSSWPFKETDKAKGMPLMKASAEQGYAPAQAFLGENYWNERNKAAAFEWHERAALQDYNSRTSLPRLYEEGSDRNLIKAYAWYAYNDDEAGRTAIKRLSKAMTPEQIAEAGKETERIRSIIQAMP